MAISSLQRCLALFMINIILTDPDEHLDLSVAKSMQDAAQCIDKERPALVEASGLEIVKCSGSVQQIFGLDFFAFLIHYKSIAIHGLEKLQEINMVRAL